MANDLMLLGIGGSDYSDPLYGIATPSLDLQFAANKSLTDVRSGNNLVTFTRASSGTFVDSQGVIRRATTNLLLRSEELDSGWTGSESNTTVTANTSTAPNGTITADTINFTNASSFRYQSVSNTPAGTTYTFSVWLASGTKTQTVIRIAGSSTGIGSQFVVNLTPTLTRYSVTATIPSGNTGAFVGFENRVAVGGGDGSTGTIIVWGAQLEQSSTVGEYIPTTSTINSAPRFDHNPTTGESLGLLVEEQRTNSIRNNTMVGAVAGTPGTLPTGWSTFVSPTGLTRTIVGSGTVNGINYIDVRFNGTPSSTGEITLYLSPATTATLAEAWTSTAWLSLAGGSLSNIAVIILRNFELNSGAYVREVNTNYVSSISSDLVRRQTITTSFGAGANQILPAVSLFATAGGTPIDITLRIGLPQLEQGAFATSVIPTTGTAATRSADIASLTGTNFSSWYNQTEGTVFAEWFGGPVDVNKYPSIFAARNSSANNSQNTVEIFQGPSLSSVRPNGLVRVNNVNQITRDAGDLVALNARVKAALGVRVNDFAFTANGSLIGGTQTSGTLPTVDTANIGFNTTSDFINGTISRITYFPQRLSNANLQRITQ